MATKIPLMLLPGLLCDDALWDHQAAHLGDIADIGIVDFSSQDSMAAMAESVLEAAPERFALAGLSMGGYVAFEVMRRAPERVERLALLDTSARADAPEQTQRRRDLLALSERGRFKGVTPQLLPFLIHADRLEDAALTRAVMDMAERIGPNGFLRQQTAIMGRPDSRPGLDAIACPTLVLVGRQDALTPVERHEEIASSIACSRLVVIEDCGHLSTMERPQAVTALLRDWLLR